MNVARNVGGFYRPHGHYTHALDGHCGLPSNIYSINAPSINVNCEIPDQSTFSVNSEQPWLQDVGVNQKLDRLLKLMEEQRKETSTMKSEIRDLKNEVEEVRSSTAHALSNKSTPESKKLPTELSGSVKRLQEKSPDHLKFDGSKSYNSERNQKVKHSLVEQLSVKYTDKYSPRKIKKAVHRYYESRRRIHNDSQPSRTSSASKAKKSAKKREIRKRVYAARRKFLKKKDQKKWDEISYLFMTEESSGNEEDVFNVHQLPWRSEELNKLVKKADKKRLKKDTDSKFSCKTRVEKSPSRCPVPNNAPEWSYTPDISGPVITTGSTVDDTTPTVDESTAVTTTPHRNPTGAIARQIFSSSGSSGSSESSSCDSSSD